MDFELTASQREYRDRARAIAQDQLLAELGGQGADRLTTGVITEEIGRADINVAYLQVSAVAP